MNRLPLIGTGIIVLIFLWIISFFNISFPVKVMNQTLSSELSVVGEGKVDVVPDSASVQAGIVVSDAVTVQEAETELNEINNKIVAEIIKLGIDKKDIKTTQYSINPNYNFENGRNSINGYMGTATVTVTVKGTEKLAGVITAATTAGANQIYDTQYTIDDPNKYREEARKKAIDNAKLQADKLSKELGIKLGGIVNIVESTPQAGLPTDLYYKDAQNMGGGTSPVLQPGSQTITSVVTLYFERK